MHATPEKSIGGFLRGIAEDARTVGRVARGAIRFSRTGLTPDDAYHGLIRLYCRTNGWSNDVLHAFVRRRNPPVAIGPADGVLGNLSPEDVGRIAAQIRERGYFQFPGRLPATVC